MIKALSLSESNRSGYTLRSRRNELKQDLTSNKRWINYAVNHLRSSLIKGIAWSYLPRRLRRSNQDLSVLWSLSIFVDPSSLPRRSTSCHQISHAFHRPACIAGFPALTSIVGLPQFTALFIYLWVQTSISRVFDLPRFILELHYYRVLLRRSIGCIAFLDLSFIECLHESLWI